MANVKKHLILLIWRPPYSIMWRPPYNFMWRPPNKIKWRPPYKLYGGRHIILFGGRHLNELYGGPPYNFIWRPPYKFIWRPPLKPIIWRPPYNFMWRPPNKIIWRPPYKLIIWRPPNKIIWRPPYNLCIKLLFHVAPIGFRRIQWRSAAYEIVRSLFIHWERSLNLMAVQLMVVWAWFNERTVQLRTLPLVPSPTGPHPARGDSGVCMCIHVCLVWSVFPTAFIVPHHLPVCRQLHTDSPAQLDSIWTWRNAHMRSEGSSPTGDRTRVARLAVQCSTDWATPSSCPFE